jgi:hypothetical protein
LTLREAVSKILAVRMSHYARALLLGYLLLASVYGWKVLDSIPKTSRERLRRKLRKIGIDPDIDIKPEL